MGKKNKGKKRARTQRLYEAARKAQKLEDTGEIGEADDTTQEMKEELKDSDAIGPDADINNASTVSDGDLQQTIRTLKILTATTQSIEIVRHSKRFKEFRRLLHPLVVQQLKTYEKGIDYRHRTTAHLAQQEYGAALTSLQACADLDQIPKQGTIQRWVREVDSCPQGNLKISLLSRILMFGNNSTNASTGKSDGNVHPAQDLEDDYEGLNKHDPQIALLEAQKEHQNQQRAQGDKPESDPGITILDSWKIPNAKDSSDRNDKGETDSTQTPDVAPMNLKSLILYSEKAEERTPPNHFDLLLHYVIPKSDTDCILTHSANNIGAETKIPASVCMVPFLSGARVLQNVFTNEECTKLIQIATTLGYRPDHPKALAEPTGIDSCEWLVPDTLQNLVFERVKGLLPATSLDLETTITMTGRSDDEAKGKDQPTSRGGKSPCFELNSINKRWRFFRYGQDCVYRPHIDGSWPESKLVPRNKDDEEANGSDTAIGDVEGRRFRQQYKYDTDASGETRSFLTFLIYLNDGFDGGATRFYRSSSNSEGGTGCGGMVAQGVQPKKGCVLVFPQGNTASLLHEGSAVTKGTKYVIRTDVLYRRKLPTTQ